MPDRLTAGRGAVGHAVLVVLAFAAAGAVAGGVWEALWQPPTGVVVEETWLLQPNLPDAYFAATALYVVLALPTGLLLGLAAALRHGREGLTLVAVLVGSALAGWLMYAVGHALGPPDPVTLAAGEPDLAEVPADLVLTVPGQETGGHRPTAFLAFPGGALLGLALIYLSGFRTRPRG